MCVNGALLELVVPCMQASRASLIQCNVLIALASASVTFFEIHSWSTRGGSFIAVAAYFIGNAWKSSDLKYLLAVAHPAVLWRSSHSLEDCLTLWLCLQWEASARVRYLFMPYRHCVALFPAPLCTHMCVLLSVRCRIPAAKKHSFCVRSQLCINYFHSECKKEVQPESLWSPKCHINFKHMTPCWKT